MSVSINGTGGLTFSDSSVQSTAATGFGFKNRIINGAMMIDQRNAGASVTPATANYTLDRWQYQAAQASKVSIQQNAGAVTPPSGFINYLGVTSLSSYSVGASEAFYIVQRVEGLNTADFAWGSANATTVTLSFWVRSSLTGTFGAALWNSAANRAYPVSYTINAANTWEQKSITIIGDTSGTWLTTNGIGINVVFGLGIGSSISGTSGAWNSGTAFAPTGATSVVGTSGATFYITGVQLEKGSTATSYDYRPYGTELALCQRYFYRSGGSNAWQSHFIGSFTGTTSIDAPFVFPVPFRASPSLTVNNLGSFTTTIGGIPSSIVIQDGPSTNSTQLLLRTAVPTASTIGYSARLYSNNNTAATLDFSAEL